MRSVRLLPRFGARSNEPRGTGVMERPGAPPMPGRVSLPALFTAFLTISLMGFGGPIVWARRILVERRGWLDDREFAEILSLCQFLPGPNVVSITVCLGGKFRGLAGALSALAGFIVIPWTLGFAVGAFLLRHAESGVLHGALRGVAAAAAGLIIATALRLLLAYRDRPAAILLAAIVFAAVGLLRLPLPVVVVV